MVRTWEWQRRSRQQTPCTKECKSQYQVLVGEQKKAPTYCAIRLDRVRIVERQINVNGPGQRRHSVAIGGGSASEVAPGNVRVRLHAVGPVEDDAPTQRVALVAKIA